MENSINSVEVTEKDLLRHLGNAQAIIENARWKIGPSKSSSGVGSYVGSMTFDKDISLTKIVDAINPDDKLLSDTQLHTLRAIRRGLQIGYYISEDYRKRSGVASFDTASSRLAQDQIPEYNEKMQTAAAVAQFVAVRHILWDMNSLTGDNAFMGNTSVNVEDVNLATPTKAFQCMMFFLAQNVSQQVSGSDERLVAVVVKYAEALQQEILNRVSSFKYVEPFADISYQLKDTDFGVSGFALIDLARASSVEFNRLSFHQIVGNRDAKHFMRMDAKRRMCYDFEKQKNPFLELGGITPVFMGYGIPGTGKSMLIAAYATMLSDLCESLGVPFLFHPLPDNIVDPFQGNSARNMLNWMKPLQDPTRIIWAPIDDAENILENRLNQGVSEGVKAAIGVFLRYTEGAYSINRGNSTIGVFTNLPEKIDPAVMSRIQSRFAIDGARTEFDFLDQDHLWWSKFEKADPGFVAMNNPDGYEWYSSQGDLSSLGEISESLEKPEEARIREAYYNTLSEAEPGDHLFFAKYFMAVQRMYPYFSSRDLRNIQSAVNLRIMDFDLPDEWFESPDIFANKDYDTKMNMILELRRANMKGLTFSEIRIQEVNRYLDNMARVADSEFEREVAAGVERHRKQQAIAAAVGEKR